MSLGQTWSALNLCAKKKELVWRQSAESQEMLGMRRWKEEEFGQMEQDLRWLMLLLILKACSRRSPCVQRIGSRDRKDAEGSTAWVSS